MVGRSLSRRVVVSSASVAGFIGNKQRNLQPFSPQTVSSLLTSRNPPNSPNYACACPKCNYDMDEQEVIDGFMATALDITTECKNCHYRFDAVASWEHLGEKCKFVALCSMQTKDQFENYRIGKNVEGAKLVKLIVQERPDIAWNAYFHGQYDFPNDTVDP